MIKRNAAKPVRVAPPMMEEQEVSTSTLQGVSSAASDVYKRQVQYIFCRKLPLPGRVHCLQITRNQPFRDDHESCFIA